MEKALVTALALWIAALSLLLFACMGADKRRAQRLLYLARTATPQAQETPTARPVPQTGNHAPEVKERGTGAEIGVSAHVSTDRLLAHDSDMFIPLPKEPDGNAPLDDLLAYGEVLESMA